MKRIAAVLCGLILQASVVSAEKPARVLDLDHWKLTLPVDTDRAGSPDEIRQPELDSFYDPRYFFASDGGDGVVFRAPCGGDTTKGSKYPRCELREMGTGDRRPAAWGTDDGVTHTMTMTAAISKTPEVKPHVVCAQIHDTEDDVMMIRLESKKLLIERNSVGDVELDPNYTLGNPFEVKIEAADGRIRVWYNRVEKLDWAILRTECYFKAGCYTQSNPERGDSPESFGESVIYRLQVEHSKAR